MVSLLQSKSILKNEYLLIRLLDRTFKRACKVQTLNYKTELPKNVSREFGKNIFSLQLDKIITELIHESLKYADKTMKKMAAAKVNESYILTEEAVRISKDLSQEASESIVRILQDDAIYYEHPKTLSKRIVDLWGSEKYRAERFARTFTADVATATTVARYRQYGVRYMEFDAEIDDRTTDQCRMLNGTIFDLEKESVDKYRCPLHMHCRSGLVPLTDDEYQPDMEFENRNFNNALDNPDDVSRAFKNIDTFNDKYRVSKFTLDQDLGARIMFDKGFSVGISGPDLSGLVQGVPGKVEFVPAKTVKEAEEWAKNNSGIKHIDYSGLDVRVANGMNERLLYYSQNYPEAVKSMQFYGRAQAEVELRYKLQVENVIQKLKEKGKSKKYIDKWIEENMVKPDLSTAHAYYNSGTGIAVNFDKQDFDKFLKMRMANVANGYHPIGCESFESMIDHEFGHLLDTTYSIRSGNTEFVKLLSEIDMDDIKNTLAEYATINQDELIAEAWTSYVNNPGHGEIADKIGNMIVDASKRKVV